ncbi:MAG: MFS transporter [Actinomycetota bacterium]
MHLRRKGEPPEEASPSAEPVRPRPGVLVRLFLLVTRPFRIAWRSDRALDTFALVHFGSVAGDTFVAIALADSVFFSVPVGEARIQVALYLALTMAPLAVAGIVLVPLLDRAGPRRIIAFGAAALRMVLAMLLVTRMDTPALFPLAFGLLVCTKIHSITKNGLTLAYAGEEDLVQANARLARWGVGAATLMAPIAIGLARLGGGGMAMGAAAVVYGVTCLLVLRLPHPRVPKRETEVTKLGKLPELTVAAAGVVGLRMATGFLIFLLGFSLREEAAPAYWFGLLAALATVGLYVGDFLAPKLPRRIREEGLVLASLVAAGIVGVMAYGFFGLFVLCLFTFVAGMSSEFGRLALQSLAQKFVPDYAHGRVFVRYEVLFQLSWVVGALAALIPVTFRTGILIMGAFYLFVAGMFVLRPMVARRAAEKGLEPFDQEGDE